MEVAQTCIQPPPRPLAASWTMHTLGESPRVFRKTTAWRFRELSRDHSRHWVLRRQNSEFKIPSLFEEINKVILKFTWKRINLVQPGQSRKKLNRKCVWFWVWAIIDRGTRKLAGRMEMCYISMWFVVTRGCKFAKIHWTLHFQAVHYIFAMYSSTK